MLGPAVDGDSRKSRAVYNNGFATQSHPRREDDAATPCLGRKTVRLEIREACEKERKP